MASGDRLQISTETTPADDSLAAEKIAAVKSAVTAPPFDLRKAVVLSE